MATDYPIEITDPDGSVRIAGLADFTDPDNAPSGGPPFTCPVGDDQVILQDNSDNTLIAGGEDSGGARLVSIDGNSTVSATDGGGALLSGPGASVGASSAGVQVIGPVGFYNTTPVAQPAAPVTLGDVIDALQALGLVGT